MKIFFCNMQEDGTLSRRILADCKPEKMLQLEGERESESASASKWRLEAVKDFRESYSSRPTIVNMANDSVRLSFPLERSLCQYERVVLHYREARLANLSRKKYSIVIDVRSGMTVNFSENGVELYFPHQAYEELESAYHPGTGA